MADPLYSFDASLPETIRAFIAVCIPEEVIAQLADIQEQLKREFQAVSWTRREAMHLTLQFLGNIGSTGLRELGQAMGDATQECSAFDVELSGIGSFGNRVLWVGIQRGAEPLAGLAGSIRGATKGFGSHEEERAFNAHVTLGRFRTPVRGVSKRLRTLKAPRFNPWRVDHFELIRSELSPKGSRYTTLGNFRIGAKCDAFSADSRGGAK